MAENQGYLLDANDAPVNFMNRVGGLYTALKGESEYPAVIAGRQGKGKTVYLPHLLGEAFWKLTRW